ncbi:MAG: FecR family protein [Candidatus Riflebacteria bacterium]|nr:FecR family protein [Candidatus Riflebacteria bacterium]
MKYHLTDKCKEAIDALLNESGVNDTSTELLEHAAQCPACQNALNVVGQMRAYESAFKKEPNSELKQKIMKKLESDLLENPAKTSKAIQDSAKPGKFSLARLWQAFALVAAVAAIVLYAMSAGVSYAPARDSAPVPGSSDFYIASNNTYKISVNESPEQEISVDNPVSLLDNEIASIVFPDGSMGQLSGPARITVLNRGFHLIKGDLFIKVKKMPLEFRGSTPHADITVLGTSFRCVTDQQKTVVSVETGKVRVTSSNGTEKILCAGESTEALKDKTESQTDSVSPIDAE